MHSFHIFQTKINYLCVFCSNWPADCLNVSLFSKKNLFSISKFYSVFVSMFSLFKCTFSSSSSKYFSFRCFFCSLILCFISHTIQWFSSFQELFYFSLPSTVIEIVADFERIFSGFLSFISVFLCIEFKNTPYCLYTVPSRLVSIFISKKNAILCVK